MLSTARRNRAHGVDVERGAADRVGAGVEPQPRPGILNGDRDMESAPAVVIEDEACGCKRTVVVLGFY